MKKINTDNILNKTNELIGVDLCLMEGEKMNKKFKSIILVFVLVLIVGGGTFTVNAMTDNSIVEGVKSILRIKVDGEDKNAKCVKNEDGSVSCTLDKEVMGDEGELKIDVYDVDDYTFISSSSMTLDDIENIEIEISEK